MRSPGVEFGDERGGRLRILTLAPSLARVDGLFRTVIEAGPAPLASFSIKERRRIRTDRVVQADLLAGSALTAQSRVNCEESHFATYFPQGIWRDQTAEDVDLDFRGFRRKADLDSVEMVRQPGDETLKLGHLL